jgi:hypothetical protein
VDDWEHGRVELAGSILQAVGGTFILLRLCSAVWRLRRGQQSQALALVLLCGFDLLGAALIPLFSVERSLANLTVLILIFISPSFLAWALAGELTSIQRPNVSTGSQS